MRVPKYVEVSDDLRLSRQKEAAAHLEFLEDWHRFSPLGLGRCHGIGWHVLTYSHLYDAQEVAA